MRRQKFKNRWKLTIAACIVPAFKAGKQKQLAGLCCDEPISDEHDFINRMKNGQMKLFSFCIDDNK